MRRLFLGILFFSFSAPLFADPQCSIDFGRVTGVVGVVAGKAKGDKTGPVYVSVKNAELTYTTTANSNGNWALTYRYFSPTVTAEAWQEGMTTNRSKSVTLEVIEGE